MILKNESLNVRATRLPFKGSSLNEDKDPLIWVWREQEDKVAEAGGTSEVWQLNDYEYSKEDSQIPGLKQGRGKPWKSH